MLAAKRGWGSQSRLGFHCLADNVTGHHFGQAGRIAADICVLFGEHFAGVIVNQDVGLRIDLRYTRDHSFDIQVIGMCSRDKGCAKSRGERQALHDTSGKNGIHGLNYDIRDGIKKSALL